jgi:hypothetical protein
MKDKSGLEELLDQLDHWRNFAAYKLEQRIDPLIGMCLPYILERRFKQAICENIIPEFPFLTERLLPEYDEKGVGSLRCDRIDYAAFCYKSKILYLIELKTDSTSVSETQLDKLQQLAECSNNVDYVWSWVRLLADVAVASSKPRKYIPIFYELKKWELVDNINNVIDAAKNGKGGLKGILKDLKPAEFSRGIKITPVLIAPVECFEKIDENKYDKIIKISLTDAAAALSGEDEIQSLLKNYLKRWDHPEHSVIPSDHYLDSLKYGR